MRRRLLLVALLLPVYATVLTVVGTVCLALATFPPGYDGQTVGDFIGGVGEALTTPDFIGPAWLVAVLATAAQVAFLLPAVRGRPVQASRPRSLYISLVIVAAIAAGLTVALGLALTELGATIAGGWGRGRDMFDSGLALSAAGFALLASWGFWSLVLLIFTRDVWPDRTLGRIVRWLLGGTIVELAIVIPIDVIVRRRTDCYCASGTFFSLILAVSALLWLAGPGALLAATRYRRALRRRAWCGRCGHAKGPSPGEKCPECGTIW
jgi:hypothetical protein